MTKLLRQQYEEILQENVSLRSQLSDCNVAREQLVAEVERLRAANEHWHTRIEQMKNAEEAAEAALAEAVKERDELATALVWWEQSADWLYDVLENQTCSDLCDKTWEQQGCPTGTCAREDSLKRFRDALEMTRRALKDTIKETRRD